MNDASVADILTHAMHVTGAGDDAGRTRHVRDPLSRIAAGPAGTVYLEVRPADMDRPSDAIVMVRPADLALQCGRFTTGGAETHDTVAWQTLAGWMRRAQASTRSAHEPVPTTGTSVHHFWFEFDAAGATDAPNVFICHAESLDEAAARPRFLDEVEAFETTLGQRSPRASAAYVATRRVIPGTAFVSYVGFMLARRDGLLRVCVSGAALRDVPTMLEALGQAIDARVRTTILHELAIIGTDGGTILHLDWQDGCVIRAGLELGATKFTPLTEQPAPFREAAGRATSLDHATGWLQHAAVGGAIYSRVDGNWFAFSRVLSHLKMSASAETPRVTYKAYVRYDWRRAAGVLLAGTDRSHYGHR